MMSNELVTSSATIVIHKNTWAYHEIVTHF